MSKPSTSIPGDFRSFIQKISFQGFFALGLVELPGVPKAEPNIEAANAVLLDLKMLKKKCDSNLGDGERMTLEKYIQDLEQLIKQIEQK